MRKIIIFTILSLFLTGVLIFINYNIKSQSDLIKKRIEEKKQPNVKDVKEEREVNIYSDILKFDERSIGFQTVQLKKDEEYKNFQVKLSCSGNVKSIFDFLAEITTENQIKEIKKIIINKNNDKNRGFDISVNFGLH